MAEIPEIPDALRVRYVVVGLGETITISHDGMFTDYRIVRDDVGLTIVLASTSSEDNQG